MLAPRNKFLAASEEGFDANFRYYHRSRPHLALSKQCPIEGQVMKDGAIEAIEEVGGLHHRYERIAA